MNLKQSISLKFDYQDKHYEGEAIPASSEQTASVFPAFDIFFDNEYTGTIVKNHDRWISDNHLDNGLIAAIGSALITLIMTL